MLQLTRVNFYLELVGQILILIEVLMLKSFDLKYFGCLDTY